MGKLMMILDKKLCLLPALLIVCVGLAANSVFSFYGIPHQDNNIDVYGMGMGESGMADVYRKNTSFFNPSLATTVNHVNFSTGISTGYFYHYDNDGNSSRTDGLHFPYFNATVPIRKSRIGFSFAPYLSGNIDVYSKDNDWEEMQYTEVNKVRSYIYKSSLFYAYQNDIINFGVALNYYLGHRYRAWNQDFTGVGNFINAAYEINETYRNPGISIGVNRAFGNFAIAAVYNSNVTMEGKRELVSRHTVFSLDERRFEIPKNYGLGFAYRLSDEFRITTDIFYDVWSETSYYDKPEDTYRIASGIAYEPEWGQGNWYRKIPLRIGGYHRTLPFTVPGNDNKIEETGFTFGFTIPLQSPNNQLEFAVKYLTRGNKENHGYQEENLLFSIGFSGFDFFRSRPRKIGERDIPEAEFEGFR
jgi:hypothetical protein